MALDFHRLDNNEFLFDLNDKQYNYLIEIFDTFTQCTGLVVDQYCDLKLTTENQETLIKIIDKYVDITDLNKDKKKTSAVLELKGILVFFTSSKVDLKIVGD
jgi:hypothetical protein